LTVAIAGMILSAPSSIAIKHCLLGKTKITFYAVFVETIPARIIPTFSSRKKADTVWKFFAQKVKFFIEVFTKSSVF
jgi:hypothetical protein